MGFANLGFPHGQQGLPIASNEKVITADQGVRINLGKSRAVLSFQLVEHDSQMIL